MKIPLYVPEENALEVAKIIITGMSNTIGISEDVKNGLEEWCKEVEKYILEED